MATDQSAFASVHGAPGVASIRAGDEDEVNAANPAVNPNPDSAPSAEAPSPPSPVAPRAFSFASLVQSASARRAPITPIEPDLPPLPEELMITLPGGQRIPKTLVVPAASTSLAAPGSGGANAFSRLAQAAAAASDELPALEHFGPSHDTASNPANEPVKLVAKIDSVRRFGDDWAMALATDLKGQRIKLTGAGVVQLDEGASYELHGHISHHKTHGESLVVASSVPHIEIDVNSIVKFMQKHFKNVGVATAIKMITARTAEHDGNQAVALARLRQELLESPWSIDWATVTPLSVEFTQETKDALEGVIQRDFSTRIGAGHGVNAPTLKDLAKWATFKAAQLAADGIHEQLHPGEQAWAAFMLDPYEPISNVSGYGWKIANSIGRAMSIEREDPRRMKALLNEAVNRYCQMHGHSFLRHEQARDAIAELDPQVSTDLVLDFGLKEGVVVQEVGAQEQTRLYSKKLWEKEDDLARSIAMMAAPRRPLIKTGISKEEFYTGLQRVFDRISPGNRLDDGQLEALHRLLTSEKSILALTGGPGCGKTALMEVAVELLSKKDLIFCAPTGIAAKILQSRVGARQPLRAYTVHSLLQGDGKTFQINGDNPLVHDMVGLDETSMLSTNLAQAFWDASHENCRLILLGDPNQLASVEPGNVLNDLIGMPSVEHAHLSVTHRNSGSILKLIHEIGAGQITIENSDAVQFSRGLSQDDYARVIADYVQTAQRVGFDQVGLLMSRRQGKVEEPGWNTTWFNAKLKEVCNPSGLKIPGSSFNVGDRIMITENMALPQRQLDVDSVEQARALGVDINDKGEQIERVVNGDTGKIVGFTPWPTSSKRAGAQWMRLQLDDDRAIDLPHDGFDALQLSYARTVHKSQGGQFKHVIVVATSGMPNFVNRSTLFTAVSRAREAVRIYGDDAVLRKIVATPQPARNSALTEKVQRYIECPPKPRDRARDDGAESDDSAQSAEAEDTAPDPYPNVPF